MIFPYAADNAEIDPPSAQCRVNLWIPELSRLQHGQPALHGLDLDRSVRHPLAPRPCTIRLRHDAAHVMA